MHRRPQRRRPSSYAWSGGASAGSGETYFTRFSEAGDHTISLTVTNFAGSDTGSTSVDVNGLPECSRDGIRGFTVGDSWSGTAEAFGEGFVTCTDDDTLTYKLMWQDSPSISVSENNGVWTVQAVAPGDAHVHIVATDPSGFGYGVSLPMFVAAAAVQASLIVIDSISCSPSSPAVDESVTCTATLSGGDPDSYAWSGGASSGSSSTYSTSFGLSGSKTVSLTVTNSAGSDTVSITVSVEASLQAPAIDSISCTPISPTAGEDVTCTATLSGGAPDSYSWSGGASTGSEETYSTSFSETDFQTVTLIVDSAAGRAVKEFLVHVDEQ